jgi:hypothetical protein
MHDRAAAAGYAGALRRSELVGVDIEQLRFHAEALEILIPRSKGNPDEEGQRISIGRTKGRDTCPVGDRVGVNEPAGGLTSRDQPGRNRRPGGVED